MNLPITFFPLRSSSDRESAIARSISSFSKSVKSSCTQFATVTTSDDLLKYQMNLFHDSFHATILLKSDNRLAHWHEKAWQNYSNSLLEAETVITAEFWWPSQTSSFPYFPWYCPLEILWLEPLINFVNQPIIWITIIICEWIS